MEENIPLCISGMLTDEPPNLESLISIDLSTPEASVVVSDIKTLTVPSIDDSDVKTLTVPSIDDGDVKTLTVPSIDELDNDEELDKYSVIMSTINVHKSDSKIMFDKFF